MNTTTNNTDTTANTSEASAKDLQAARAARMTKAVEYGITTGKVLGLIGAGILMTVGYKKFKARNNVSEVVLTVE